MTETAIAEHGLIGDLCCRSPGADDVVSAATADS
jgi:hypothetical protein